MKTTPVIDGVTLSQGVTKITTNSDPRNGKSDQVNGEDQSRMIKNNRFNEFLVKYRERTYDVQKFLEHHPGGRKTLSHFRNQNLDNALRENPHSKSAFHLFEECLVNDGEDEHGFEKLIDWNKAIFWQVGHLADQYWEWVNLPVNRPIKLFESNLLEIFTVTPWFVVPLIWIPVCLYFLYRGFIGLTSTYSGYTPFVISIAYGLGVLLWTFLEYVLHRKLFHFQPPASSKVLISLHFLLHGVHHKAPFDGQRLLFPPVAGMIVARLLWSVYTTLIPQTLVPFIAAGTTTGYLFYDLTHYYLHHGSPAANTFFYTMKRSHNYHHFLHHNLGFGISSRMWDRVFDTDVNLRELTKPIKW